jgi:hypothetical protein
MRGASRLPTYVGRILIVAGFIMIVIAWDGAASLDFIQGQFPYLLSGAMPGLALIIVGAGLEYVQTMRQTTAERAKQMAELNLGVIKLIGYVKETGGLIPGPDAAPLEAAEDETARLAVLDHAGHALDNRPTPGGTAGAAAATATMAQPKTETESKPADPADSIVVAGRSSFHDPECHLVSGRDDMASMTRLQAEGQGLSACRVCKP